MSVPIHQWKLEGLPNCIRVAVACWHIEDTEDMTKVSSVVAVVFHVFDLKVTFAYQVALETSVIFLF